MDKKMTDRLKDEQAIPDEVMEKLVQNRKALLSGNIPQEKMVKKNHKKQFAVILAIAAVACLIVITKTPISAAIENALGISRDPAVETVESQGIPTQLDLTSTQNGREIKLTKFVATKKKIAFDYQFTIDDEKLRTLVEKEQGPKGKKQYFMDIGLFADGGTEDLFGGVSTDYTFRVEGDTFYGSVIATFTKEKIPENAKLTLHIYKLWWQDQDEFEAAQAKALAADPPEPFTVETALAYEGDWTFDLDYQPLTQTAVPQISNAKNIDNITAKSDALQTTVRFYVPINDFDFTEFTLYKNGVKLDDSYVNYMHNETGESVMVLDLSAMDKTTIYKIEVKETDTSGELVREIGSFELQNK